MYNPSPYLLSAHGCSGCIPQGYIREYGELCSIVPPHIGQCKESKDITKEPNNKEDAEDNYEDNTEGTGQV